MEQPVGQPAYVLHSRAYKETSALVDFFTPQGRMRAVLRRARGKGGSLVRPFVPLELELRGRGELKNVGRMDSAGIAAWLHGDALFSGLYLNELLMRLLPAEAPFPALFEHYTLTLQALQPGLFRGSELAALAEADWDAPGALLAAKRLMRQALAVHLGAKPLVSRELFRKR